jgi:predicted transcriptional regulator
MNQPSSFQSVKDIMDRKIIFIDGMATAKEAVEIMKREMAEALIVKKRHEHDAYGILVIKDIIRGTVISDRTPKEVNVFEIMTKPVIAVPYDMDVRYIARLLMRAGLQIAPVEENGKYIGIISLSSLVLNNVFFK